ncbi:MAG: nucleoside-diphosphate kinase [Planctomycetes bacterium]|nr:nucleoside-diphosphate kinase [Planctomycetota bacterium]
MEKTLLLIKPDGVERQLVGEILSRFEKKGFRIAAMKLMRIDPALAERHYEAHKARPFYKPLVRFMTSGPVVAFVLAGANAVAVVRKMVGATFGPDAEPGTVRGDYGLSRSFNLIHASDTQEAARREVSLFFAEKEILDYPLDQERWIYDAEDVGGKGS